MHICIFSIKTHCLMCICIIFMFFFSNWPVFKINRLATALLTSVYNRYFPELPSIFWMGLRKILFLAQAKCCQKERIKWLKTAFLLLSSFQSSAYKIQLFTQEFDLFGSPLIHSMDMYWGSVIYQALFYVIRTQLW